jgi:hypothetical protein
MPYSIQAVVRSASPIIVSMPPKRASEVRNTETVGEGINDR